MRPQGSKGKNQKLTLLSSKRQWHAKKRGGGIERLELKDFREKQPYRVHIFVLSNKAATNPVWLFIKHLECGWSTSRCAGRPRTEKKYIRNLIDNFHYC